MGEHDVPEINAGYIRVSESIPERILADVVANSEDNVIETVSEIAQHIATPIDFDTSAEIAVSHETISNMMSSATRSAIDSLISSVAATPSTADTMIDRVREIEAAGTDDVVFRYTVDEEPADNRRITFTANMSSGILDQINRYSGQAVDAGRVVTGSYVNAEWNGSREYTYTGTASIASTASERQRLHFTVVNITIIYDVNELDHMERRPGTLVLMANGERTWISDAGGRFCELSGNVQLTTSAYGYSSVEADEIFEPETLRNRNFTLDESDPRIKFINAFRKKIKTPATCDECGAPVKNRSCVYCHKRF